MQNLELCVFLLGKSIFALMVNFEAWKSLHFFIQKLSFTISLNPVIPGKYIALLVGIVTCFEQGKMFILVLLSRFLTRLAGGEGGLFIVRDLQFCLIFPAILIWIYVCLESSKPTSTVKLIHGLSVSQPCNIVSGKKWIWVLSGWKYLYI